MSAWNLLLDRRDVIGGGKLARQGCRGGVELKSKGDLEGRIAREAEAAGEADHRGLGGGGAVGQLGDREIDHVSWVRQHVIGDLSLGGMEASSEGAETRQDWRRAAARRREGGHEGKLLDSGLLTRKASL